MKKNFEVFVKNSDGRPHVRAVNKYQADGLPVVENGNVVFDKFIPMTLRQYAMDALATRTEADKGLSLEDGWKRMKLHDKLCFSDGEVDIKTEEAKMILDALNNAGQPPLVVGRMKDLLDNDPEKPADA